MPEHTQSHTARHMTHHITLARTLSLPTRDYLCTLQSQMRKRRAGDSKSQTNPSLEASCRRPRLWHASSCVAHCYDGWQCPLSLGVSLDGDHDASLFTVTARQHEKVEAYCKGTDGDGNKDGDV